MDGSDGCEHNSTGTATGCSAEVRVCVRRGGVGTDAAPDQLSPSAQLYGLLFPTAAAGSIAATACAARKVLFPDDRSLSGTLPPAPAVPGLAVQPGAAPAPTGSVLVYPSWARAFVETPASCHATPAPPQLSTLVALSAEEEGSTGRAPEAVSGAAGLSAGSLVAFSVHLSPRASC